MCIDQEQHQALVQRVGALEATVEEMRSVLNYLLEAQTADEGTPPPANFMDDRFYLALVEYRDGEREAHGLFSVGDRIPGAVKQRTISYVNLRRDGFLDMEDSEEQALQAIAKKFGVDLDQPDTWKL